MVALCTQFGVSERRTCRVVDQPRSTQRLAAPVPSDDELALRVFLRDFARRRPRLGWRRAVLAAKAAGWRVNSKRVHRLWIAEGLRVPYRKRKKPLRGIGKAMDPFCPIRPNVVWALDFQFDQTSERSVLREGLAGASRTDASEEEFREIMPLISAEVPSPRAASDGPDDGRGRTL